jgi:hypothetical protein
VEKIAVSILDVVLKSGDLNLLEPYGPVQACNGIALPIHNYLTFYVVLATGFDLGRPSSGTKYS